MSEISTNTFTLNLSDKNSAEVKIPIEPVFDRVAILKRRADEYLARYNHQVNLPKFDHLIAEASFARGVAGQLYRASREQSADTQKFLGLSEILEKRIRTLALQMTGVEIQDKSIAKARPIEEIGTITPDTLDKLTFSEAIIFFRVLKSATDPNSIEIPEKGVRLDDLQTGFSQAQQSYLDASGILKEKKLAFIKKIGA